MDLVELRQVVDRVVLSLGTYGHKELDQLGPQLGLAMGEGSRNDRVVAAAQSLADEDLAEVARRILNADLYVVGRAERFALEDALWAGQPVIEISGRLRRALAQAVDLHVLVYRRDRFERLLDQLWVLDNDPLAGIFGPSRNSLRAQITQHVFENEHGSTEGLFERLGALETGHARFAGFLEGLVSPDAVPDVPAQRRIVDCLNPVLAEVRSRLEETGLRDGYPLFRLVRTGPGGNRRPKNLIFGSPKKPDIRFLSAIDNDIEIVGAAPDEFLVYERPIGPEGLLWSDLQDWWRETRGIQDETEAKNSLRDRLIAGLPPLEKSPQAHVFFLYVETFGTQIPGLPALLPEVWLHWDHETVAKRGRDALLRFRMDFLMLLPYGRRVVLEIDGAHHYSTSTAYTKNVSGDRDMKLTGYEVFRFSNTEISDVHRARPLMQRFFNELFERYEVPLPARTYSGRSNR
jgi:hypothetical protein